mmetsp:Transcript_11560/g.40205  ORF Transcript_11560/g.40205 Transcript_11560/m.40205 type:complete len:326 (-) Transcript_11560:1643-2620(-)
MFTPSIASSSSSVGVSVAAAASSSDGMAKSPVYVSIFFTRLGSDSSRDASRSPASMTEPGGFSCEIVPVSDAISGMTIFIASASAYGLPASTTAPSSCRKRMSLPVTSVRSSLGSNWNGRSHVLPSRTRRSPSGSSRASIWCASPSMKARSVPSLCSRTFASTLLPPRDRTSVSGLLRATLKEYFTSWYVSSIGWVLKLSSPCRPSCPFFHDSLHAASFSLNCWWARQMAADATMRLGSSARLSIFVLMRPSSHEVSMVFSLNSSVSRSWTRYSTAVRISPRTTMSFRASTSALRASSLVGPLANTWPNWLSANSWIPPLAPTEK